MLPLTQAILDDYLKYSGDMLAYVQEQGQTVTYDWDRISELLERIFLIRAGHSSANFRAQVELELAAASADLHVRMRLWDIAGSRVIEAQGHVAV
jgi:hypothetical protein